MDLQTRLLISTYRSYIGLVGRFSPERASAIALERFLRPRFRKQRSRTIPIFRDAQWDTHQVDDHKIAHYHWQGGTGPTILLAHGWESDAGTFAPMIEFLLDKGWSVRALDAPAHGQSSGNTVNLPLYSSVLRSFLKNFQDIDIVVGHSFGGMALAHANDTGELDPFPPSVIVGSALELRQSLAPFVELLNMTTSVKNALYERIHRLSGQPVHWYSIDRMLSNTQTPFLVAHDKEDKVCPIRDLETLMSKELPHVDFHITSGLGHNRILKATETFERIIDFAGTFEARKV